MRSAYREYECRVGFFRGTALLAPFAPLRWCARGACWLYSRLFLNRAEESSRTEINFRVNKGDHHELAPAPVMLVFSTVVASRHRVCSGSAQLRCGAVSAECRHIRFQAAVAGG